MKHQIVLADKEYCSGCASCMNVCPVDAIEMRADREGFIYPYISEDKCVRCKKCQSVCPAIVSVEMNNLEQSSCYAVWATEDVRMNSSSGGMFSLLAEQILEQDGIVYGVAFDAEWNASHIRIDTPEGLSELRGSKYMQSSVGYAFRQVKKDLAAGKKVLFSGTPCQIAGLYNYLGSRNKDLLTVDLLCHGVPSAKVFQKYLKDSFGDKCITDIKFRDKRIYKWSSSMHIEFADGSQYDSSCREDIFYKGFLPCLTLRPSCENCRWSANARVADISIGDFWGIHNYDAECDDRKGTSSVLINTELGRSFFEKAKKRMALVKKFSVEKLIPGNPTLVRPFQAHSGRKHFFNDLDVLPIDRLTEHALNHKYDIGIAGLWYGLNYGSILTYYALYKVVNQLGYDAIFLDKPDCLWNEKYNSADSIAQKFIRKRCNVTGKKASKEDWRSLNNNCDTFMVGSDVIWNYEICGKESGEFFFLNFINNGKKKIAYASSFGSGYDAPEDVRRRAGYYLRKFDAVSVREFEAQEICKKKFDVVADRVLDAVFLCNRQEFIDLAEASQVNEKSDFIASYILGPEKEKKDFIKKVSSFLELPCKVFVDPNEPEKGERLLELKAVKTTDVEDWLYHVKNCKFFIADSFHGVCFAIIFKVPFVCYIRRDEPSKCRFFNLLELCGLEDRIIFTDEEIDGRWEKIVADIDYDTVYQKLAPHIEYSLNWLKTALEEKKENHYDFEEKAEDIITELFEKTEILQKRLEQMEKENNSLKKSILMLSRAADPYFATVNNIYDYLSRVLAKKNKVYVALAVKDTPGHFLDEKISGKLREIGFEAELKDKHWYAYVGICGHKNLGEQLEKSGVAELQTSLKNKEVKLCSKAFLQGDVAQIIIDGVDYAINKRGLNIVLISKRDGRVLDAVCFDTHTIEQNCYR